MNDPSLPPVFVIGYPDDIGGASTELWHTLKLWRAHGLAVSLIHTWGPPKPKWRAKCASIGCQTHVVSGPTPDQLRTVPGLAGSTIVSFCNEEFLVAADVFRGLGCKTVWAGCMCYPFDQEKRHYNRCRPFDAYVFQSRHQLATLRDFYAEWGVSSDDMFHIPGAFDVTEFPFSPRPHKPGEPLVIGRVSRAAPDKFAADTFETMAKVKHPTRLRFLGVDDACMKVLGQPPEVAEMMPMGAESAQQFFSTLHVYCQLNGDAVENWPRSGLEAMATGVPIVAERKGGWAEMIQDGAAGFLCDSREEVADTISRLAEDEELRIRMAEEARRDMENYYTGPMPWGYWHSLFASVAAKQETIA